MHNVPQRPGTHGMVSGHKTKRVKCLYLAETLRRHIGGSRAGRANCDFKQIFAVWQGYDLFAKASCNPFNRRVAPSYWIKHPGTGSACQSGEGQSKTITYERNRYDGQRFIGSHESGSATFTVLLLAQPRRRCKPIGETRALAGLGFQCGMKAARFSGTVQHLWRLSPVIPPSIRW